MIPEYLFAGGVGRASVRGLRDVSVRAAISNA